MITKAQREQLEYLLEQWGEALKYNALMEEYGYGESVDESRQERKESANKLIKYLDSITENK